MAERISPQMVLASTAHRQATALFPAHRSAALLQLDAPESMLLLEWSARRDAEVDDLAAWRQASPHWSPGRQRLLEQKLARAQAGESLDPDETDPMESFRSQFLNIWPVRTSSDPGTALIDPAVWAALTDRVDTGTAKVFVAVEDNYGRGAAVAAVARLDDGRYELDGWLCESWAEAFADVDLLCAVRERVQLSVGATLAREVKPRRATNMASAQTRAGLALLRQLVASGQVVHDDAPDLEQVTTVRVRELPSGLAVVAGSRADLARAAGWALLAAHDAPGEPRIH